MEAERAILIVVGAHLAAEEGDRPIAYRLRDRMMAWLHGRGQRVLGEVAKCAQLQLE